MTYQERYRMMQALSAEVVLVDPMPSSRPGHGTDAEAIETTR